MRRRTTSTRVPSNLGSPRAKLVYLYLATNGSATITELQRALDMTKLALYGVVKSLRSKGIVDRTAGEYVLT